MVVERELSGWKLAAPLSQRPITSFTLRTSDTSPRPGFTYTLSFPLANAIRALLIGPDRPAPPHSNVVLDAELLPFTVKQVDTCEAVIAFPTKSDGSNNNSDDLDGAHRKREARLEWSDSLLLSVWEEIDGERVRLSADLPCRSYALTEHGVMRHWLLPRSNVHFGLGEKGAPLDLGGRSFSISATDAACYDAYNGDPLYKHTPFLISAPRPKPGHETPSTYAIYHTSNANSAWDLGRLHDDPWGYFKTFTQEYGGLEEWLLFAKGPKEVTRTWAEIVGRPLLVGRDWLGYLASGMGLGESDDPPAQELLARWPELCREHGIPCSAIHFSSGYTVGPDGNRYVFTMNKERYPDFAGLVAGLHRAGIKVVPNIKPYVLETHPAYKSLHEANALFYDPHLRKPVVTRIWSSGVGVNGRGSWVDMTSAAGRKWWADGVRGLIELGVDGMWNDNNEYFLHDDAFLAANQLDRTPDHDLAPDASEGSARSEPQPIGVLGRLLNTELVGRTSSEQLLTCHPHRRPYVLTRSASVGTMKYVCSTWTGDNETSWRSLRGSQAIQLNSGMSLLQSTGSDVGGFGGPVPSAELLVRWVQLGVTHARFCIHAFKPSPDDPSGAKQTNTPWMYPAVLPVVRAAIQWRYRVLPFLNALNWRSHERAEPTNAWLGWGAFASDPRVYEQFDGQESFDAWIGEGQLLSAPQLWEGGLTRDVYFPQTSSTDDSLYFDLHAPHRTFRAGTSATIATPLEHMGLFAREGAAIPVGKSCHTVTQREGPGRTTPDGIDVVLEDEGGMVGLDDWRGVEIFPGLSAGKTYTCDWVEDDGISAPPVRARVELTYTSAAEGAEVEVKARWLEHAFHPAWGSTLAVLLPVGDARRVAGAQPLVHEGRTAFAVQVSQVL